MTVSLIKDYVRINEFYGNTITSEECARNVLTSYTGTAGIRMAEGQGWNGFAVLMMADGSAFSALSESDYMHGLCECERAISVSNTEAICEALDDVDEKVGRPTYTVWDDYIAYDYACKEAREVIEGFECALSDYPLLDEMRCSELEYEALNDYVYNEVSGRVPSLCEETIIASVVSHICQNESPCGGCGSVDIDDAMNAIGFMQCHDCSTWLESSKDDALCMDCADGYTEDGCECVSVYLDTMRHGGHAVGMGEINETMRGCADCYAVMYPYGREAVTA
ncbi:hypothetical protein O1L55_20645 [Streptomyces albulus]|nr:hypothetical protein [Streptomyces noursei]